MPVQTQPELDGLLERPSFRETVELAAHLVGTPMAAITILGKERQWFKASVGLPVSSTTMEEAFCRYTVQYRGAMIVEDAHEDDRFHANPLVLEAPHIRSYIGVPLTMPDGARIGAVCALDRVPRRFDRNDENLLRVLSRQAVAQLQLERLIATQAADIEQLQVLEASLIHEARHDALTGLLNRRGFVQQLERLLDPTSVTRSDVTVMFIDLDDFKAVNDRMSHETGDRVLAIIAKRLERLVGPTDLVARLGGDEFIVALPASGRRTIDPNRWARAATQAICAPISIDGLTVVLGASVGVAQSSSAVMSASELIDHADQAMYTVKGSPSHHPVIWSPTLHREVNERRAMRAFVRSSIAESQLIVHYQPIIDLETGDVLRREALLRWQEPYAPTIDPSTFVSIAESIGLIAQLGRDVLVMACRAAQAWQNNEPGVGVSVNVSAAQLVPSFVDEINDLLTATGLAADLLTLEIVESSLLERTDTAGRILERIHQLGVRIAIDDFGTGYSSMAMLCNLPIDEVKIDRQICSGHDTERITVANASIRLGHSLGLEVVAEGIETQEILDRVLGMGCTSGQGFLFGRPGELVDEQPAFTN